MLLNHSPKSMSYATVKSLLLASKCWEFAVKHLYCSLWNNNKPESDMRGSKENPNKGCSFTTSENSQHEKRRTQFRKRKTRRRTIKRERNSEDKKVTDWQRVGWRGKRQNSRGSSNDLIKWFSPECLGGGGEAKAQRAKWRPPTPTTSSLSMKQHSSPHSPLELLSTLNS